MENNDMAERNKRKRNWCLPCFRHVTVEPVITFYMLAFMITTVVEQSFFVNKACRVNHKFNETVCQNLHKPEYSTSNTEVQKTVSTFLQWNNIAGHIIPIFLALFMGAWSDRRGRKLPLILGLIGKLYYSLMIVVNTLQPKWPVEYIIYTATLPSTLTGADVIIFAAGYSYIADVSTTENRTLRITIMDVCYLSTMPIGIALGRYLFSEVTNRSYTILFIINASLLAYSIMYALVALEWTTTQKQKTLWSAKVNVFTDFFDKEHVIKTYKSITRRRPFNGRLFLTIFIFMMMLYTFQRDEKDYSYLFFKKVAHWDDNQYSKFRTLQSALYAITMLVAMPIMNRVIGLRDSIIIMIGACSHALCRLIFVQAPSNGWFYAGAVFSGFGPIVAPTLRSMTSKLVSSDERGRVFSVLSVADNAVPFISGFLYTQVYNATLNTYPQGIFWLTFSTQAGVFLLILFVHFKSSPSTLIHTEFSDCNETCIKTPEIEEQMDKSEKEVT